MNAKVYHGNLLAIGRVVRLFVIGLLATISVTTCDVLKSVAAAETPAFEANNSNRPAAFSAFERDDRQLQLSPNAGFIGIYADAAGTDSCLNVARGAFTDFHILVDLSGEISEGFAGAEFRIEISNPDGYIFSYLPPEGNTIVVGNPIDDNPDVLFDGSGVSVAFTSCQTAPSGQKAPLGRLRVVNIAGGPTRLSVKRRSRPTNPTFVYPILVKCDAPFFSLIRMRACRVGLFAEQIAFETTLNFDDCTGAALCSIDCGSERPTVELTTSVSPFSHCSGDPVQIRIQARNTSSATEQVELFINREWIATRTLQPNEVADVVHEQVAASCDQEESRLFVAALARNEVCEAPWGTEIVTISRCVPCDQPADCTSVRPRSPREATVGEEFSVSIFVGTSNGPAIDLFGLSGRLQFTQSEFVEALRVECVDLDGTPMDLGPDVLCFGQPNNTEGYIDFAVTRKNGSTGMSGILRVARLVFRYRSDVLQPRCVTFSASNLEAIDSQSRPLCVEGNFGSQTCPLGACDVWPGDTNNDGRVDADDIATLGLFWGEEGRPHHVQNCAWEPSQAFCFANKDATFSDAFGDGRVGAEDLLCIGFNWNKTHPADGQGVVLPRNQSAESLERTYQKMLTYLSTAEVPNTIQQQMKQALVELIAATRAPAISALGPGVPNPFNPSTTIHFDVAQEVKVSLSIYDVLGRQIRSLLDESKTSGRHTVLWNGKDDKGNSMPSGIYYVRALIGQKAFSRKLVLVR